MNNLWLNLRFGAWHLQIGPDETWFFNFRRNGYWDTHEMPSWFEVM